MNDEEEELPDLEDIPDVKPHVQVQLPSILSIYNNSHTFMITLCNNLICVWESH